MGRAVAGAPLMLGAMLSLMLCLSLQALWRATFGPFLLWLASIGISIHKSIIHIDLHPFTRAKTIEHDISRYLSQGVALSEKGFVKFLNWVVEPFLLVAGVILALGLVTYEGMHALWKHVNHAVTRTIHTTITKPVHTIIRATTTTLRVADKALRSRVAHLEARVRSIAHAIPHAIPTVIPRVGRLEKQAVDYVKLHKWLKRGLLGALGATVVATALKKLGLGWARCKNVTRFGKQVCGVHPKWLDDFLAGMIAIVGATSVVEFCEEAQKGEEIAFDLLAGFVRELKGLDLDRAAAAAKGFATHVDPT